MIFRQPFGDPLRIYIRPGRSDMRKGINGLVDLVEQQMELDSRQSAIFLFCGSGARSIKLLYWDGNGYCLWHKRLEVHRFYWPEDEAAALELTSEQLLQILAGIDFRKRHKIIEYQRAI